MTQRYNLLSILSIVFIGLVVLYPSLDIYFVSDNIGHIEHAAKNVTLLDYRYFRPLTIASLWLDLQMWGANFTGYHITNLVLHIIMSVTVYLLAIMMVRSRFFGLSAAFFFLLHPIHSLDIFWISGRTDMICGIFYISSLLFFIRYFKTEDLRYNFVSILLFILALLSKEMAVSLPLVALAYALIFEVGHFKDRVKEAFRLSSVFWLVLIAYLAFRYLNIGDAAFSNADHNLANPLLLFKNLAIYLGLLVIPGGHIEIAQYFQANPMAFAVAAIAAILVLVFSAGLFRRSRLLFFTLVFTLITLLPVLRLVMRWYLYIPSVGICLGLAYLLYLTNRSKRRIFVLSYGGVLLVCWIYAMFLMTDQRRWINAGNLSREYTGKVAATIAENQLRSCYLLNVPGELAEVPVNMFGLGSFLNFRLRHEFNYSDSVSVKRISYLSLASEDDFRKQVAHKTGENEYELALFQTGAHFFFPKRTDLQRIAFSEGMVIEEPDFQQEILEVNNRKLPVQMIVRMKDISDPVLIFRDSEVVVALPDSTIAEKP